MAFGWKLLIPVSLVWIVAVATIRAITLDGGIDRQYLLIGIGVLAVLFLRAVLRRRGRGATRRPRSRQSTADAFAGGFPVPPMPAGGAGARRRAAADVRDRHSVTEPTAAPHAGEEI